MSNIVFLDIDGVVNTLVIGDGPFNSPLGKKRREDGYYYNICNPSDLAVSNKQAVLWLNKICIETNSNIVLSSTWRFEYEKAVKSLYNSGLNKRIKIIGCTPRVNTGCRGEEIHQYIIDNNLESVPFIVLDDDTDMGQYTEHLIQCNTYVGLTYNEYSKAKELLRKMCKEE